MLNWLLRTLAYFMLNWLLRTLAYFMLNWLLRTLAYFMHTMKTDEAAPRLIRVFVGGKAH